MNCCKKKQKEEEQKTLGQKLSAEERAVKEMKKRVRKNFNILRDLYK